MCSSVLTWAPPPTDPLPPDSGRPPDVAPAGTAEGPAPSSSPTPTRAYEDLGEADLPYETEQLQLSEVLELALTENLDLQNKLIAIEISEAQILAASGAFDVTITAGLAASVQVSKPRGSAFVFSTGSRSVSANFGVSRRLETGGNLALTIDVGRTLTDQPISFFNPALGSATLAQYQIRPTLTFMHPLLKGMGVRVNRAAQDRARLARSSAEADQLVTAQNLVRDLIGAYWDVLAAQRDLDNKRQSVELAKEQLSRTQAQVAAGRLAAVESKAVEQSLAQRETDVLLAENLLLDTSLRLRTLMGQEFAGREVLGVVPGTDPVESIVPEPVDMQGAIDRALAANPAVRQLEIALASKRIDEIETVNQRLPQLDFTGTFSPQGRSVDALPDPSTGEPGSTGSWGEAFRNFGTDNVSRDGLFAEYTVSGALDLTWSVQNRTARGNHQRVLAEMRQAEVNLKSIRQNTATQVITATNSLRSAAKQIELGQISVELAEQNLAAEQARFEVGRATNYDVLFRIDELLNAQTTLLRAGLDYLRARAQLQALTGEILPAYGLDIRG
ncbi:outer membrane channel protein [Enhygromyxa salina]|uniref:Outer membrane channel protein n=1 Tax=Enhygromyxa salina TaxID=215803 RepID=A0A2S9YBV7_9BACT|nr:outer membrane channel protein [Enhygromyxa salina]